jgi:hypothetical protein
MKTKLRKEFEEYRKETDKKFFLMENPAEFHFGEELFLYRHTDAFGDSSYIPVIYKGESYIKEVFDKYCNPPRFRFYRICFLECNHQIIEREESSLVRENPNVKNH